MDGGSSQQTHSSHIGGDVLESVSSWLEHKTVIPVGWRTEMAALKSLSHLDLQSVQRSRVHDVSRRLQTLHGTLLKLANLVEDEIDAFAVVKRKCGIALLPDEILGITFGLVIEAEYPRWPKWRTAVKLSHINSQSRSAMLSCPRFWASIDHPCSEMVVSCLPRTNGLPLSISLTVFDDFEEGERSFEPVVSVLLPISNRWGRLDLTFYRNFKGREGHPINDTIGQSMGYVNAPLLEELCIFYDDFDNERSPPWDWSLWNTPKLRSIRAVSYFPFSLPGLSNVTSLHLDIAVENERMSNIFVEISRMDQLQELAIEFLNTDYDHYPLVLYDRLEVPQLRYLTLKTELHSRIASLSPVLKRSLLSSLFFPGLVHLSLEISGRLYDDKDEYELLEHHTYNYYFNKEINRIFRHKDQFPNVENLRLQLYSPRGNHHNHCAERFTELSIPLNMLPNLKHLELWSNTRLDVKEPENPDEVYFDYELTVPHRVVGDAIPILRTVTLDMRDPSVVAGWLGDYFTQLRARRKWDEFRELFVMEDEESSADGRRKVSYLGDSAMEWCSTRIS